MSKEKVDRSKSEIGDSKGNLAYKERKRWTLFGLPFTFTEFYIYDNDIQIRAGLIDSNEDDCYMYRITDVKLKQSLFQKMFGLGTVECYTSDERENEEMNEAAEEYKRENKGKIEVMTSDEWDTDFRENDYDQDM